MDCYDIFDLSTEELLQELDTCNKFEKQGQSQACRRRLILQELQEREGYENLAHLLHPPSAPAKSTPPFTAIHAPAEAGLLLSPLPLSHSNPSQQKPSLVNQFCSDPADVVTDDVTEPIASNANQKRGDEVAVSSGVQSARQGRRHRASFPAPRLVRRSSSTQSDRTQAPRIILTEVIIGAGPVVASPRRRSSVQKGDTPQFLSESREFVEKGGHNERENTGGSKENMEGERNARSGGARMSENTGGVRSGSRVVANSKKVRRTELERGLANGGGAVLKAKSGRDCVCPITDGADGTSTPLLTASVDEASASLHGCSTGTEESGTALDNQPAGEAKSHTVISEGFWGELAVEEGEAVEAPRATNLLKTCRPVSEASDDNAGAEAPTGADDLGCLSFDQKEGSIAALEPIPKPSRDAEANGPASVRRESALPAEPDVVEAGLSIGRGMSADVAPAVQCRVSTGGHVSGDEPSLVGSLENNRLRTESGGCVGPGLEAGPPSILSETTVTTADSPAVVGSLFLEQRTSIPSYGSETGWSTPGGSGMEPSLRESSQETGPGLVTKVVTANPGFSEASNESKPDSAAGLTEVKPGFSTTPNRAEVSSPSTIGGKGEFCPVPLSENESLSGRLEHIFTRYVPGLAASKDGGMRPGIALQHFFKEVATCLEADARLTAAASGLSDVRTSDVRMSDSQLLLRVDAKEHPEVSDLLTSCARAENWAVDGDAQSATWNVLWTWAARPRVDFNELLTWQKVNHFPNSKQLTRKDLLKGHLARFSRTANALMPITFTLPREYLPFVRAFSDGRMNVRDPAEASTGVSSAAGYETVPLADVSRLSEKRAGSVGADVRSASASTSVLAPAPPSATEVSKASAKRNGEASADVSKIFVRNDGAPSADVSKAPAGRDGKASADVRKASAGRDEEASADVNDVSKRAGMTSARSTEGMPRRPDCEAGVSPQLGDCDCDNIWIMKPVGRSRGEGIFLVSDIAHVAYGEAMVVQKYVERPLLLYGHKFDLRLYVLVTSFNPLEAFLYQEGFARFASRPYTRSAASLDDMMVHLTNTEVQKQRDHVPSFLLAQSGVNTCHSKDRSMGQDEIDGRGKSCSGERNTLGEEIVLSKVENRLSGLGKVVNGIAAAVPRVTTDSCYGDRNGFVQSTGFAPTEPQTRSAVTKSEKQICCETETAEANDNANFKTLYGGCKVSLGRAFDLMVKHGVSVNPLWRRITALVLQSCEAVQAAIPANRNCFELFGYDVLVDETHRPWLVEVNSSPSMETGTPLDCALKGALVRDTLALIDPLPFNREALAASLHRRALPQPSPKSKSDRATRHDPHYFSDLDKILNGRRERKWGELPTRLGNYQRIAPAQKRKLPQSEASFAAATRRLTTS